MRDLERSVLKTANDNADQASLEMAELYEWERLLLEVFGVAALVVGAPISALTGRSITQPLEPLTSSIADLARGRTTVRIPELDRADEFGDMAESMGVIREAGVTTVRAQKTLENTEAYLVMVDSDGRIAHVNRAFSVLADRVRENVEKELSGFATKSFEGQPFDAFHNEPTLQGATGCALSFLRLQPISSGQAMH